MPPWPRASHPRQIAAEAQTKLIRAKTEVREVEREEQAAQAKSREERETELSNGAAPGLRSAEPAFDPESRFRSEKLGTGEIAGAGLAGAGSLKIESQGVLEPGTLFNLVA